MATGQQLIEDVEFIVRSRVRVALLETLDRDGPLDSVALRETVDCSRTTVQRNLDRLEDAGLVRGPNRTYALTPCGELVTDALSQVFESMALVRDLSPVLRWVAADQLDVDVRHFADAEVTVADSSNPFAPVNAHVAALESVERIRAVLPSIGGEALRTTSRHVKSGRATCEVVLEADCAETLRNDRFYASVFEDAVAAEACSVSVYQGDVPFYVGILDDRVQVGIEDGEGRPRGLLETDSRVVREWATDTYETYRRQAVPLSRV